MKFDRASLFHWLKGFFLCVSGVGDVCAIRAEVKLPDTGHGKAGEPSRALESTQKWLRRQVGAGIQAEHQGDPTPGYHVQMPAPRRGGHHQVSAQGHRDSLQGTVRVG